MKWVSSISTAANLATAIAEAADEAKVALGAAEPSLAVLFVSHHHAAEFPRVGEMCATHFPSALMIGCSGGSILGAGREIEDTPGLALALASLPGVEVHPFYFASNAELPGVDDSDAWTKQLGVAPSARPNFLLLPEPFSFDTQSLLGVLDHQYPGSTIFGGIASGARQAGDNALFLGGQMFRAGAVGLALAGDIAVDTIVAQGCRPIGQPMFATGCHDNVIWELDGRPALEAVKQLYASLTRADQELANHSLFVGVVMRDQQEYRHGDFLIRNLMGIDGERGAIAVGTVLHEGAVVQFHLRDARTSAGDLEMMLQGYHAPTPPSGALLFSCLGRGVHLYGEPDHDSREFRRIIGDVPLTGFFCNGEIGQVHGSTFLHGYTSSFALFRRRFTRQ
ncbi:MAG: FIST C-terminal domain-containing protein [Deltaproteobacteria bacterium]|nr:FIST C-terminal domain-containing protein [Deltaproteobacteria bacterium]